MFNNNYRSNNPMNGNNQQNMANGFQMPNQQQPQMSGPDLALGMLNEQKNIPIMANVLNDVQNNQGRNVYEIGRNFVNNNGGDFDKMFPVFVEQLKQMGML